MTRARYIAKNAGLFLLKFLKLEIKKLRSYPQFYLYFLVDNKKMLYNKIMFLNFLKIYFHFIFYKKGVN